MSSVYRLVVSDIIIKIINYSKYVTFWGFKLQQLISLFWSDFNSANLNRSVSGAFDELAALQEVLEKTRLTSRQDAKHHRLIALRGNHWIGNFLSASHHDPDPEVLQLDSLRISHVRRDQTSRKISARRSRKTETSFVNFEFSVTELV